MRVKVGHSYKYQSDRRILIFRILSKLQHCSYKVKIISDSYLGFKKDQETNLVIDSILMRYLTMIDENLI